MTFYILYTLLGTLIGLVIGVLLCYFTFYRPIFSEHLSMIERLYSMKRQGFVPQFKIDHPKPENPAKDVVEY